MPHNAIDAFIRSRNIDVLLELGGHSGEPRLLALIEKPAPVVISAIGYPNTTGVPAIEWRLVDAITDPVGSERFCTEQLLRIDPCFLCYTAPTSAPEPAMPDASQPITFGSFNNATKIGARSVELWARVLQAVPGSRLLMKAQSLTDSTGRKVILERFAAAGIAPDRLELVAYTKTRDEHLRLYNRVHVALDTVPYNGTTTTCEALWMGVPVVTTLGDRHAARVSASLLHAAGHPELVASDADAFVRIAASLAQDRPRLDALRTSLRTSLPRRRLMSRIVKPMHGCSPPVTATPEISTSLVAPYSPRITVANRRTTPRWRRLEISTSRSTPTC
jgi:predicted O-linked N-acetylglucosamine transferase (SPINDLY family)